MNHPTISPREQEILHLIANEHNTNEIAKELYLSPHTVITHRKNLLNKMNVRNTAGLVRKGFELGLLLLQKQSSLIILLLIIVINTQGHTQCNSTDWKVLRDLYTSTNGDSWTNNSGWGEIKNNASPTANCAAITPLGVTLNANGRVEGIVLSDNNLTGTLNDVYDGLAGLKALNLDDNLITGVIPPSFGELALLEVLSLQRNRDAGSTGFTGSLPIAANSFPSLRILRWNKNTLTGSIPHHIRDITQLEELPLLQKSDHVASKVLPRSKFAKDS